MKNAVVKKNVFGVNISAADYVSATNFVILAAKAGKPLKCTALAVHGLMIAATDFTHASRINSFDLVCPDGQPVRWALNLFHRTKLKDRVYGPKLMLEICAAAERDNINIGLFGCDEDTLTVLKENLTRKFPNLLISTSIPSKFRKISDEERASLLYEIKSSGTQILFVGIGCPRQEIFAYENSNELNIPIVTVGAAFDFHAGKFKVAPRILQSFGLEWFYRFIQEPRRLWKRYLKYNSLFILYAFRQKLMGAPKLIENARSSDKINYG